MRRPGQKYDSDRRRWFRVDSEELPARTADLTDAEFRAFILLLAYANEHKAQERDDTIVIARSQLLTVSPNSRESVAKSTRTIRELSAKQSWTILEEGAKWTIRLEKYSQKQGFAPARPAETPLTTPTPKTTPTTTPIRTMSNAASPLCSSVVDSDPPKPAPTLRAAVLRVWPKLVARAAKHGSTWAPKPGKNQIKIIEARLADGATEVDIERAVEGYIVRCGATERDGFDPLRYFTASTIFRASKFDANVQASYELSKPGAVKPRKKTAEERYREQEAKRHAERIAEMGEYEDHLVEIPKTEDIPAPKALRIVND